MFEYYSLFIFITLLGPINSIYLFKKFQLSAGTSLGANILYCFINGVMSAAVPAVLMLIRGTPLQVTPYSLLIAFGLVALSAVNTVATLKAYEAGQMAIVSIISTVGSIVFSCAWGVLVLKEKLSIAGFIAVVMMLSSVILIQQKTGKKTDKKLLWLYAVIVLSTSLISILGKQHQVEASFATVDTLSFSVWIGVIRAAVFAGMAPFLIIKKGRQALHCSRSPIIYAAASSAVSGTCYIITLFTNKVLPIVITSPLSTGLNILMCTLLPWLFFRERLSGRQIVGAILSLVGAVLFVIG